MWERGLIQTLHFEPQPYLSLHKHAMLQNVVNKVEMKKVASEE